MAQTHREKYNWSYIDLTDNPPKFYKNFDTLLYQGGFKQGKYLEVEDEDE